MLATPVLSAKSLIGVSLPRINQWRYVRESNPIDASAKPAGFIGSWKEMAGVHAGLHEPSALHSQDLALTSRPWQTLSDDRSMTFGYLNSLTNSGYRWQA